MTQNILNRATRCAACAEPMEVGEAFQWHESAAIANRKSGGTPVRHRPAHPYPCVHNKAERRRLEDKIAGVRSALEAIKKLGGPNKDEAEAFLCAQLAQYESQPATLK